MKKSVLVYVLTLAAIVFFSWALRTYLDQSSTPEQVKHAAEEGIRPHLYNPEAAKFSGASETTIRKYGRDLYEVDGWEESATAFGAMARAPYDATVTKIGGKWVVTVYHLHFDQGAWK